MQAISRGGGDCATRSEALCAHFVNMGELFKTQLENGLSKLFDYWGQTIAVSKQVVFILKNSGIRDEEEKKSNVRDPLTESQRRSGSFFPS